MANDFYKTQGGFNIYDSEIKDINETLFKVIMKYGLISLLLDILI